MIVRWHGAAPSDERQWVDTLFDTLGEEARLYWVRFYQAAGGWRFDLERRDETPGTDGWPRYRRADEGTKRRVFASLVERGKPLDPSWSPSAASPAAGARAQTAPLRKQQSTDLDTPLRAKETRAEALSVLLPAANLESDPRLASAAPLPAHELAGTALDVPLRAKATGTERVSVVFPAPNPQPQPAAHRLTGWRIRATARLTEWRGLAAHRLTDWRSRAAYGLTGWRIRATARLTEWRGLAAYRLTDWRSRARRLAGWRVRATARLTEWRGLAAHRLTDWRSRAAYGLTDQRSRATAWLTEWRGLAAYRLTGWRSLAARRSPDWRSLPPVLVYTPAILLVALAWWLSPDRTPRPATPAALSQLAQAGLEAPAAIGQPSKSTQASPGRQPAASMPSGVTQRPPKEQAAQPSRRHADEIRPTPPPRRGALVDLKDPGLTPPLLVSGGRRPPYPPLAWARRRSGTVWLNALVEETGRVTEVALVRSSEPGLGFEDAAMTQLHSRVYRPATKRGVPVKVRLPIEVKFQLAAR